MPFLNAIVFGPASGSVAFASPGARRLNDDTLFIGSSFFELGEGGIALRALRRYSAVGSFARIAIHKQCFEPNMARIGHSMGAAFEFEEDIPRGAILVPALRDLLLLLEHYCVRDRHFCELKTLEKFVDDELEPSIGGLRRDLLLTPEANLKICSPRGQNTRHIFLNTDIGPNLDNVADRLDWFFEDIAASLYTDGIFGSRASGRPGQSVFKPQSLEEVNRAAVREFAFLLEGERESRRSAEREQSNLRNRNQQLENEVAQHIAENQGLQRALENQMGRVASRTEAPRTQIARPRHVSSPPATSMSASRAATPSTRDRQYESELGLATESRLLQYFTYGVLAVTLVAIAVAVGFGGFYLFKHLGLNS